MIWELTLADEEFLTQVTGASPRQIRKLFGRARQHARFCEPHRSAQEHFGALSVESADLFAKKILDQYAESVVNHSVRSTGLLILFSRRANSNSAPRS
jgi:hypothetical protein